MISDHLCILAFYISDAVIFDDYQDCFYTLGTSGAVVVAIVVVVCLCVRPFQQRKRVQLPFKAKTTGD
jgi:bacteriorhodopsin